MSSRREEKKHRTRRDLASAAVALLLTEGQEAATVPAITARAGVSTRTFHNYFTSREDAHLFFLEETVNDWAGLVAEAPPEESPFEVLRRIITDVYARPADDLTAPPNLVTVGEHVVANLGAEGRRRAGRVFDDLRDALVERSGGTLTPFRALTLINVCLAASGAVLETARREQLPAGEHLGGLLDEAFDFLARGCR